MKPKTSIKTILHRARISFSILVLFFLLSFTAAIYAGVKTGEIEKKIVDPFKNLANEIVKSLEEKPTVNKIASPGADLFSEFEKATPPPKSQKAPVQPAPLKECYRYTVVHLDGSSSNLCYSKSDYNQLVNLGYNLSSAKTFYDFHKEGAQKYQEEYNATGSKIYLDAKASSERDAQRQQDKIGQITLQMQEIEKRGY